MCQWLVDRDGTVCCKGELTVVDLSVQRVGGSLDEGVGDTTELRVVDVAVNGVGVALLGEEKEFLEQHCV